jgi:hypothetical protein
VGRSRVGERKMFKRDYWPGALFIYVNNEQTKVRTPENQSKSSTEKFLIIGFEKRTIWTENGRAAEGEK